MKDPSGKHPHSLRIATRGSELALWQAAFVARRLRQLGYSTTLVTVETQGDRDKRPFGELQGQGFFTKAVQDALREGLADIAVHSYKDLPSAPCPGLEVAALLERADPRDVLLVRPEAFREDGRRLPLLPGVTVGTGAARRQKQLQHLRPDLVIEELRGNVPTRVEKLRHGAFDAVMLAAAGLQRLELDLTGLEAVALEPSLLVPAPAQGVLALEVRREDAGLASILTDLHSPSTQRAAAAERGLMAMLQGGCQLALGAYAQQQRGLLSLCAWYEGNGVVVEHPSSEGAAMLAWEALGRPGPVRAETP